MLQRFCADDIPAIGISDSLMPETDPQQRHFAGKLPDHIDANPGIFRYTRSWGKDDAVQIHRLHLIQRQGIIAHDQHIRIDFTDVLVEVIRKGIIIIDQ
ncbi:hypothetical protein SDC9_167072 [bioreactor metagenome]|uniref:Uncharacterized protein n=1 Tax=bioreactor metagenome TaxID=1076179 RepID=A0A645G1E0_9ZZZZ